MPGWLTLGFAMHLVCFVTITRKGLSLSIGICLLPSIKHCIIKYQVLQIWCVLCELMPWHHRKLPRSDNLGVSDMKGLIPWVAQQISTVTRLIHDKHAPDYLKQEREKLYPTKPGLPCGSRTSINCGHSTQYSHLIKLRVTNYNWTNAQFTKLQMRFFRLHRITNYNLKQSKTKLADFISSAGSAERLFAVVTNSCYSECTPKCNRNIQKQSIKCNTKTRQCTYMKACVIY